VKEIAYAHAAGAPGEVTSGFPTELRASAGEDWTVPCDPGRQDFDDWWDSVPLSRKAGESRSLAENAWEASRQRHTACLRRVGWLDQHGRVWTRIPSGSEYNGGSYTPLLIDVRD